MKLAVICFTGSGFEQMKKLKSSFLSGETGLQIQCFCKCSALFDVCGTDPEVEYVNEPAEVWAQRQFEEKNGLLFIGAAGIAVRAIAPGVRNKLTDSPVIVMNDNAGFVIPLLSGHVGGANEIAVKLAEITGAVPVITTATDVHGKFAVDLFAKRNNLAILNKDGIAKVSAKVLAGEQISVLAERSFLSEDKIQGKVPDDIRVEYYDGKPDPGTGSGENIKTDVYIGRLNGKVKAELYLLPKIYVLGIGCRRAKTKKEIKAFVEKQLAGLGIDQRQICKVTSIDVKKEEAGLIGYAEELGAEFEVFPADVLNDLAGDFSESEFVRSKVGVGCVSERAAAAGCVFGQADDARSVKTDTGCKERPEPKDASDLLILRKQAGNGVTLAIAKKDWRLSFDE